tara:strand:- start:60 stop:548 length:489 start_codon:yes stop_codon:yes gene_type:complete
MALTKVGKEGITGISNASDATFLTATSAEGVTLAGTLAVTGAVTASDDMNFNSGYGSAVTAYGCRAWINFNGTGTIAIRDSGNVGSITDNATGDYTVTFAVGMPDVNYSPSGTTSVVFDGGSTPRCAITECATMATGSQRTIVTYDSNTKLDSAVVSVQIFR